MKARILIAEDDANIRVGLAATLESEGYAVTSASDGAQALRLFPQAKFDLVVLDVMMPRVSGYDVCRELRAGG
jgi:DNA-binding response OmpR family regulator